MIKKEIILKASRNDVWQYITSENHLGDFRHPGTDCNEKDQSKSQGRKGGIAILAKSAVPPKSITYIGCYGSLPVATSYDLVSKRNKTILKVTVSGWDNVSQSEARKKLPKLSLEWERRLMSIKMKIESGGFAGERAN